MSEILKGQLSIDNIKKELPQQRYNRKHQRQICLAFYLPSEQELWDFIQSQSNKINI